MKIISLWVSAAMVLPASAAVPPLIPHPVSVRETGAAFDLPSTLRIHLPAPAAALRPTIEAVARGWSCSTAYVSSPRDAVIAFQIVEGMENEAYTLRAESGHITIRASGLSGFLYGWQTLRPLAERREKTGLRIPAVAIEDSPRFPWRGLMLDSSRHIQSVPAILRLLDQMASLKLNRFHWHLTDNNGWRIEVPSYPRLAKTGGYVARGLESQRNGYFTQAQMRAIATHARALNIEIIPEIDLPGHAAALAESYPEFLCPSNRARPPVSQRGNNSGYHEVVCVANESFYDFIRTVFKETRDATGCTRMHIGGDEVERGTWSACPLCSARMKQLGIKNESDYQKYFLSRIAGILKDLGMESVYWIEDTDGPLPKVGIGQSWRFKNQMSPALAKGMTVIQSCGQYAYLDYPEYPGMPQSSWMPVLPLEKVYQFPIVQDADRPHARRILGGEATLWTEEVLESDMDPMLFPRLLALAEQWWSPDAVRNWTDFQSRLERIRPAMERQGIRFSRPPERGAVLSGRPGARVESTAGFHRALWPEYAFDGRDTTAYISDRNGVAGDTVTLRLETPMTLRSAAVITGGFLVYDEKNGAVRNGTLEVSADGQTWDTVARTDERGQADAPFDPPRSACAIRLRLDADMKHRMVVNEFTLVPAPAAKASR